VIAGIAGAVVIVAAMLLPTALSTHRHWKLSAQLASGWRAHRAFYLQEIESVKHTDTSLLDPGTLDFLDRYMACQVDNQLRCLEYAKYFEGQIPDRFRAWYLARA